MVCPAPWIFDKSSGTATRGTQPRRQGRRDCAFGFGEAPGESCHPESGGDTVLRGDSTSGQTVGDIVEGVLPLLFTALGDRLPPEGMESCKVAKALVERGEVEVVIVREVGVRDA